MQSPALEPHPSEMAPEPAAPRPKYLGLLSNTAKIALALVILAWLARSGRLQLDAFARLDARASIWLLAAALLQVAMIASMAVRWRAWLQVVPLENGARARLRWREVLVITARGVCAGAWTPAGLGLDGVRAVHALRRFADKQSNQDRAHPNLRHAAQDEDPNQESNRAARKSGRTIGRLVTLASLLDRGVALVLLVVLALPFVLALAREHPQVLGAGALVFLIALPGVGAWWVRRRTLPREILGSKAIGTGFNWRVAGSAGAWALGTHVANVLALGAVIVALSPGLEWARALRVTFEVAPAIILSGAIPLTPLGLGVADATGEALLARHGLSCGGEAVMLVRALWLVVCLACGVAFWLPEERPEEAGTST